ncbi:alanyl-tRNA editing protein AlaX-L [Cladorrhinum sp. PSN259]|nr:alanyl-tRNA editing protein AlaX-L [Cladorrhinum sp. PSN259]
MASTITRTFLAFQHNSHLHTLQTIISSIRPLSSLEEPNRLLFKQFTPESEHHVLVTPETIFHPQGGGQPSDEGTVTLTNSSSSSSESAAAPPIFHVKSVRMSATDEGQVLHLGQFSPPQTTTTIIPSGFAPGSSITQTIDSAKRLYHSRLHTAGHVLGSAVRDLLEKEIPDFDELKASHFPDSAACEFLGLIEGKWKEPIQKKVDELISRKLPVEIDWWDEEDFKREGLERLVPDRENGKVKAGEKFRVVKIVGAEVYPCGGTHVDSTDLCGEVRVKKIGRSKGVSRVSYAVDK